MNALVAENLAGGYGLKEIVRGVSLTVNSGECLAVLGPNGAGKSTLIRLLAGILPLRFGNITLFGQPFSRYRRREIARLVGYVPQLVNLTFPLSVRELVEQGRAPHLGPWRPPTPEDHRAVIHALEQVGMLERADQPVQQLSGGERQLVLLARALATQPRILLLDEPATALDVRHQVDLVGILRDLLGIGCTVVMVVHDWNLALRLADRLVVLEDGHVVAEGPSERIASSTELDRVFGITIERMKNDVGQNFIFPRLP